MGKAQILDASGVRRAPFRTLALGLPCSHGARHSDKVLWQLPVLSGSDFPPRPASGARVSG